MDLQLSGKTALVIGASKGLGFGIAQELAKEGTTCAIASSNKANIEQAAALIQKETNNKNIRAYVCDIAKNDSITKLVEEVVHYHQTIDLLVVNSGGPPPGSFFELDDTAWQDAFNLLLFGAVRLIRKVTPIMKQSGGAILVNTSSSIKIPIENLILSTVLRSAVAALTKSLSVELARDNIRINNLVPGRVATDRVQSLDAYAAKKKNISISEQEQLMNASIPLNRYGTIEEYGKAAAFLLSPAASYITGSTLFVDGGMIKAL